ncbi:DUF1742-domain-containing protein [Sparassis crispa]|uniref:DUF1742-domain-containing protein n=1 Tax=Sparassis crispa TaxID=139825 RepID=A0A401GB37_9APHY|nr:DUF1742-domain-containing protein [Sparassis crispa]GBE79361.1 DUF1742-domain-containing protein [Sparassis crispa]
MSFSNIYYKRAVGTARACYVCHKPTTTVLATIHTVDFIYTCDNHLTDHAFATRVGDPTGAAAKLGVGADEIAKVKKEWEEHQKVKLEKAKEKEKEKEKSKDKEKEADAEKGKKDVKESKDVNNKPAIVPGSLPPDGMVSPPPTPSHERYTLHRDVFAMRQAEQRRRRQAAQAKELAPRLPGAPRSSLPPAT